MKMLKCLLTDSDVLLFILNAMTIRFPEVPPATCSMLTIFIRYVIMLGKKTSANMVEGRCFLMFCISHE